MFSHCDHGLRLARLGTAVPADRPRRMALADPLQGSNVTPHGNAGEATVQWGAINAIRHRGFGAKHFVCFRSQLRSLGADGEVAIAWPEHDGHPAIPAIHRVAPIAHVTLVLAGVGLERRRRYRVGELILVNGQRQGLNPLACQIAPLRKDDGPVDELLERVGVRGVGIERLGRLVLLQLPFVLVLRPIPGRTSCWQSA